jgi:hypothetical protein
MQYTEANASDSLRVEPVLETPKTATSGARQVPAPGEETAVSGNPRTAGPQRVTRVLLVLFLTGICSRGYGFYNQQWKASPAAWTDVLHGTSAAPEQYRIGVVIAANWLGRIFHLRLSQAFGVLDLAGSVLAVLLLYRLIERGPVFRRASLPVQWFASATFVALTLYYVDWTNWYQKVATLPTAALVAIMLWLWTPPERTRPSLSVASPARQALLVGCFFLVALVQALVRADVALMICLGIFIASLLRLGGTLALPRSTALLTSFVTALAVAGVQLYLMRVRYPHASYDGVPVFMLRVDFTNVFMWASCLIFLAPFLWTVAQAMQRRSIPADRHVASGPAIAFLLGSVGYLGMWLTLGRLDEVRIFIPMALVNLPLTVELAMQKVMQIEIALPAAR